MDIAHLLEGLLPPDRVKTRLIDLAAFAPDAGFYYLLPRAVVQPVSEEEVIALFAFSRQHGIPLTFRTGGTSLSGQAISGGLLVDLSRDWKGLTIAEKGESIRMQAGVIGARHKDNLNRQAKNIGPR